MTRANASIVLAAIIGVVSSASWGQTTVNASSLAMRSGGTVSSSNVTLSANGYLGTYITLASPGAVTLQVNASGTTDAGTSARLGLAVGDSKFNFNLTPTLTNYTQTVNLPAGTHFIRTQYDNDSNSTTRAMTMRSLTVSGATVVNTATDATALAAANTYIDNYRKGSAVLTLTGPGGIPLLPGTNVRANLTRNAFNFGGTVSGTSTSDSRYMLASNPALGTQQYAFQKYIDANFNTLVPSNAGKWAYNEATRNVVTMQTVDAILNYAQNHGQKARMHTLLWGSGATGGNQQPNWVNTLIANAAAGDAASKTSLSSGITSRINSYVGTSGNRSQKYIEIDGLNESLHNPSYWNIYGASGVASIYNQIQSAINATGSSARIYLNEWNVLQFSPATVSNTGAGTGFDPYANWYRQNIDDVRAAGGAVTGAGIQYYADARTNLGSNNHGASNILRALQNLSVTGMPISLTEFGLASGTSQADGARILDDTMRMVFGTPDATTFMMWSWWDLPGSDAPAATVNSSSIDPVTGEYALTEMGQKWKALRDLWKTDTTVAVDANGQISFNGFYGDYSVGGQANALTLTKGTSAYAVQLNAPPTWSLWNPTISGDYSTAANWTNGGVAIGVGTTAHFPAATASRSVNLAVDVVLGQINFLGTGSYTLIGAGRITLDGSAGVVALNAIAGSHQISNDFQVNDALTARVEAGATLTLSGNLSAGTNPIAKTGNGVLVIRNFDAGTVQINAGVLRTTAGTTQVAGVAIADGATLDVAAGAWVITYGAGASPQAALLAKIISGRAGGTWGGTGITSSAAALDSRYGLALADTTELGLLSPYASFSDSVVVMSTLRGDANLTGTVDFDDVLIVAQSYGQSGAGWTQGDSNYDGLVDFADLLALAQNYGGTLVVADEFGDQFAADWTLARSLVPEPVMALIAGAGLLCFRRRLS